jgi:hypothetical protein
MIDALRIIFVVAVFTPAIAFNVFISKSNQLTPNDHARIGTLCCYSGFTRRTRTQSAASRYLMNVDQVTLDQGLAEMMSRFPDAPPQELRRFLRKRQGDVRAAAAVYSEFCSWVVDTLPVRQPVLHFAY